MQADITVSYWNENALVGMRLDIALLAVHRFRDKGSNIHGIPRIADKLVFVVAKVANVENVALSGCGSVHEEYRVIVEPDVIVNKGDKNWDLEVIMTAK